MRNTNVTIKRAAIIATVLALATSAKPNSPSRSG